MNLNGSTLYALLDSGASVSLISNDLLDSSSLKLGIDSNKQHLNGVTGTKIDVLGKANNVPLTLNNLNFAIDLFIVSNTAEKMILGRDFMQKYNFVLDYSKYVFENDKVSVPIISLSKNQHSFAVICSSDVKIKPEETMKVDCKIALNGVVPGTSIFTPLPDYEHVDSALLNVTSENLSFNIVNQSEDDIEFLEGQNIGKVESISADTLVSFVRESQSNLKERYKDPMRTEKIIQELEIDKLDHLTDKQKQELKNLISEFPDVWALERAELGLTDWVTHKINLATEKPIVAERKFRKIPLAYQQFAKDEINELLDLDIIERSDSEYSSPVFFMRRNGKSRILTDFRVINSWTVRSQSTLPSLETIICAWPNSKLFSSMDFRDGYMQVAIEPGDRKKCAFTMPSIGHFNWKRVCLGLNGAPATFMGLVEKILQPLDYSQAQAFLDDIISGAKDFETMLVNLRAIFNRIRQSGLKLKPAKTKLCRKELDFLGVVLSSEGIKASEHKLKAIRQIPEPKTYVQIQKFIGMCVFYKRFIKDFSIIAAPLSQELKGVKDTKEQVTLSPEAKNAFKLLKEKLTNPPCLGFPDRNCRTFVLVTDASGSGMGGVLSMICDDDLERPIAYSSKMFNKHQKKYETYKKELYSLLYNCVYFKHYLLGKHFIAYVDNITVSYLKSLNTSNCSVILNWLNKLSEFDFTLHHRKGSKIANADYLSRIYNLYPDLEGDKRDLLQEDLDKDTVFLVQRNDHSEDYQLHGDRKTLLEGQMKDGTLHEVRRWLIDEEHPQKKDAKFLEEDLRKYYNSLDSLRINSDGVIERKWTRDAIGEDRWLICVPKDLRQLVISMHHDLPSVAHQSSERTLTRLREKYYFPKMALEVDLFVKTCPTCFKHNLPFHAKDKAELTPLKVSAPGVMTSYDIFGPVVSSGIRYALIMIDHFTKWLECSTLRAATAQEVAKAFINNWVSRHGVPSYLRSDRGASVATANVIHEMNNVLGIQALPTTAYRPCGNAQSERSIRSIKAAISKVCEEYPEKWHTFLPQIVWAHNTGTNSSMKMSPFFLEHGRHCRYAADMALGTTSSKFYESQAHYGSDLYHTMKKVYDIARENLGVTHEWQKRYHDLGKKETSYVVGDKVLIYKPFPKGTKFTKFKSHYFGPYTITKKVGSFLYEIDLNKGNGAVDVVHMERMKKVPDNLRTKDQSFWDKLVQMDDKDDREQSNPNSETIERSDSSDSSDSDDDVNKQLFLFKNSNNSSNSNRTVDECTRDSRPLLVDSADDGMDHDQEHLQRGTGRGNSARGGYNLRPRMNLKAPKKIFS